MVSLNLRNANGSIFDPSSYSAFKSWLQGRTSTSMAYDLSANLAAMKLSVLNGKVSGSALISTPGTGGANAAGFATVNDLLNEANAELGLHGLTTSGSPFRAYQTALRDVSRAQRLLPPRCGTFETRTSKGMRRVIAA
jgi:hypothetical protein